MKSEKLQIEVELLKLYKPIATSAGGTVDKIAEKLKLISDHAKNSDVDVWSSYREKVYDLLKFTHKIHTNYENYKLSLIKELQQTEDKLMIEDGKHVKYDEKANVLFVVDANGNKELL